MTCTRIPTSAPARALLIVLGLVGCPACGTEQAAPPARNLLLVSLDTLRADRLGIYGYASPTSPKLDAFATRGAVFDRLLSESSWTLPAHVTMLSGRAPGTHRVEYPSQRIGPRTRLLAEHLLAAGFRTEGNSDGVFITRSRGFERGFQHFDEQRKGLAMALFRTRRFLEQLDPSERFFAFVHSFDIHCPYEPAPSLARAFSSPTAEPFDAGGLCGNPSLNSMSLSPGQVRHLSDLYDASIREADGQLGGFLAWMEESGRLRNTLVVITSDHGEAFGEHGQIGHERSLHRELLHVPLLIVGPRVRPGLRIDRSLGLADLAPTLLDLPPLPGADGRSLAALLLGRSLGSGSWRPRVQHARLRWNLQLDSVATEDYHLIVGEDPARVQLYDWRSDPLEARNLAPDRPRTTAELLSLARRERERSARSPEAPRMRREDLNPEQLEELQALGYALGGE